MNNSNFTENAITGTNNNDGGAAIANMANDVVVANSTFTKNTAEDNGGAIYNEGNNLAVSNSIFDNNTAGKSAGAIFNNGGSNFKVDNSNFTNNEAKTNVGGAIYNEDESAIISNSVFDSNVAKVSGAAIANVNAAGVKVTGSNFTNNKAASGAAIYNENGDNLAVSDSIFNDNEVTTMGGAIYGIGNGLTITSSKFNNNKATQQGGAIINMGDSLTVKDSTFDNNTANTGGAIADVGTTFNVNNATFTNNKATGTPGTYDGGAIYYQNLMGTTGLTVKDSTFDSNTANIGGGAIVNWAFNLDIEGSTFNNNKVENESGMGGAIVNIFGGTVKDSTFDNNTANAGGAIFNMLSYETYSLSVNNVTFNANEATLGAAIYNYNTATNVDITGSKFTNNNAVAGAIYNNATGFTVSDSEFANNNATLGVDVCNAEKGVLDLTNNKYTVITGDKTNVYNIGTLAKANITVLDNKTVKAGYKDNITVYATITIDTASVAGKNLTFTINGTDQLKAESLLNGKYVANFTTEVKGIYPVTSAYDGVNTPDYYSGVLNVSKADPVLNMTVSDIFVGDLQIIAVKINNGATGLITLYINNNTFNQTLPIYEGEVKFYLQNLSAGNYSILLNYTGDENFNNGTNNTNFTVFKRLANLTVDVANITFGDDAIILISLPSDITNTTMIVYVNDVPQTVNITNGFGKLILSNLDAGNYTIKTKFESNYKYLNDTFETTLNVAKADPNLNVIINNVVYGENSIITATVTGVNGNPLSGSVIVTINGKTYEVIVDNDKGILEDAKLGANYYYTFDAYWKGDDNYNDANDTGSFSVEQAIPTLDVIVTDIIVGDDAFIEIFLPEDINGTVYVSLDGASLNKVTLINGYGNITYKALANDTYEGLPGGEHSVKVWYPGNANYTDIEETYKFNVTKFDVDMDVDMGDIVFGDNETIVVILPDDATGDVNITVDGKSYIRSLENGKANVTISGLNAGTYDVNITYSGNGRYNDFEGFTAFDVAKANSELNVEISDVNIGEEITITATLVGENGALVNGTVSVLINGKPYTIKVVDSEGNVSADAIDTTGNVSFIAIWDGDNNYNYDYDVGSFEVTKVTDCNVTIDIPGDIKAGENSTISVKVPEDATGNVTISIDGKNYTAAVKDGVANVTIPPLDAGKHNITTTYSGDNKYDAVTKNGTITVESAIYTNVNLTADNVVMIYNDGSRFKAVLLDADGNPIANATLVFAINGVSYDRITDANGTASIGINLAYGLYNVTVSYAGDDKYNATSVNATVNIISSIAANDLVKMWRNGTQFYANFTDSHGNPLVNTTVRFNINGVFYKRDTNANGTAMLNINLNPGKYILTAYNNVTGEQRGFNVLVKSLVETTDLTKYYMNESRFEAKVYNYDGSLAANKTVTFNINGVFYKGTSDANGTVSLAIKLRPANYTITSMYEGLSIGNSVEVLPTLQTSDLSMTYNDGSAFKVKTLDGQGKALANQNITFNVNGMFYYKTTGNDGVASLNINLAAGEYIITSIWDDYQVGNKITIKR